MMDSETLHTMIDNLEEVDKEFMLYMEDVKRKVEYLPEDEGWKLALEASEICKKITLAMNILKTEIYDYIAKTEGGLT